MLEMICAIPENVGWIIVGALGAFTLMMMVKLIKMFIQMWKDHRNEAVDTFD